MQQNERINKRMRDTWRMKHIIQIRSNYQTLINLSFSKPLLLSLSCSPRSTGDGEDPCCKCAIEVGQCHTWRVSFLGVLGSRRWYSRTLLTHIKTYTCCWSMCPDCQLQLMFYWYYLFKAVEEMQSQQSGARISWIEHPTLFVLAGNLILMSQRQCWQMLARQLTLWVSVGGSGPTSGLQHRQLPEHNVDIWFDDNSCLVLYCNPIYAYTLCTVRSCMLYTCYVNHQVLLGCYWLVWSEFYLQTNRFGDGLRSKQNGFCICATLRESGHPKCTNIWMQGYAISGNKNGSNTRIMMQSWTAWADEIQVRLKGFCRQEFQIWWWLKIASSRNTCWLHLITASICILQILHVKRVTFLIYRLPGCSLESQFAGLKKTASVTPRLEACSEEDLRERKAICQWRLGKATFPPPCISRCKCNIHKHLKFECEMIRRCLFHASSFPIINSDISAQGKTTW